MYDKQNLDLWGTVNPKGMNTICFVSEKVVPSGRKSSPFW